MSACVLLLCPLDMSRWITSGRIRPLWFSRPVSEEATQTLMNIAQHTCAGLWKLPVVCFGMSCIQAKRSFKEKKNVKLDSSWLCSPFLQAAAGLWLVTDSPTSVGADFLFIQHTRMCVYVFLSAPLSCPTSAQIRASVSRGRQKNIKIKLFFTRTLI